MEKYLVHNFNPLDALQNLYDKGKIDQDNLKLASQPLK